MNKHVLQTLMCVGILSGLYAAHVRKEPNAPPRYSDRQELAMATNPLHRCYAVPMGASWAEWFRSVGDMKNGSDFGVVGTISNIGDTTTPNGGPPSHQVTINVERTIYQKNGGDVPASITFTQTGGEELDGVAHIVEDDPLFQFGERVVLFFEEYQSGSYRIAGGPTGRYAVDGDGNVSAVVGDGVPVDPGTSVDAFASM